MNKTVSLFLICFTLINGFSLAGCTKSEQVPKSNQQKETAQQSQANNGQNKSKNESKNEAKNGVKFDSKNGQKDQLAKELKLADYYPLIQGATWEYLGEGNEYASFNRKVLFTKANLAQVREDNGGTVSASVIKTDAAVTRIFFQGEAYDETNYLGVKANDNLIILKAPIKKGTTWKTKNAMREITDTNAVIDTPAGRFTKCLQIKITEEQSVTYEYYHAGIGLVHREFTAGDTKVTSSLSKYSQPK